MFGLQAKGDAWYNQLNEFEVEEDSEEMQLKNIDHFVITTSQLDSCLHFYSDILGMTHEIHDSRHTLKFASQKINLHTYVGEFTPYAKNAVAGGQDFCLIADGDIYEIKKELETQGVEIIEGVVERYGALGLMDSIYMYDPDGNLVEIAVYRYLQFDER